MDEESWGKSFKQLLQSALCESNGSDTPKLDCWLKSHFANFNNDLEVTIYNTDDYKNTDIKSETIYLVTNEYLNDKQNFPYSDNYDNYDYYNYNNDYTERQVWTDMFQLMGIVLVIVIFITCCCKIVAFFVKKCVKCLEKMLENQNANNTQGAPEIPQVLSIRAHAPKPTRINEKLPKYEEVVSLNMDSTEPPKYDEVCDKRVDEAVSNESKVRGEEHIV